MKLLFVVSLILLFGIVLAEEDEGLKCTEDGAGK